MNSSHHPPRRSLPGGPYLAPNRRRSGLRQPTRIALHIRRDHLLAELAELDDDLVGLTDKRRDLLDELHQLRATLWPVEPTRKGRRPTAVDYVPLSPTAADPLPLWGPKLRRTCRAVLRRHGALTLGDLHDLLHRYGYVVVGRDPVKTLGDALGYEHDQGRLERPSRGVYRIPGSAGPGRGRHRDDPLPPEPSLLSDGSASSRVVDPDVIDDPDEPPTCQPAAAANPPSRSAMMSSIDSSPTDRRTRPGSTPDWRCSSSVSWLWVVVDGWMTRLRVSPMLAT